MIAAIMRRDDSQHILIQLFYFPSVENCQITLVPLGAVIMQEQHISLGCQRVIMDILAYLDDLAVIQRQRTLCPFPVIVIQEHNAAVISNTVGVDILGDLLYLLPS